MTINQEILHKSPDFQQLKIKETSHDGPVSYRITIRAEGQLSIPDSIHHNSQYPPIVSMAMQPNVGFWWASLISVTCLDLGGIWVYNLGISSFQKCTLISSGSMAVC